MADTTDGTLEHFGIQPRTASFKMLDLFAGAGGMSYGLMNAGFEPVAAVEIDPSAADTYEANMGHHILREQGSSPQKIEDVDFTPYTGRVDLLAGGPPCQGFSNLGTRLSDDPRNRLWFEFMRAVETVRPRAFIMENVPPILASEEGRATIMRAEELGYQVVAGTLSAELYGVPQKRKRAFFIGLLDAPAALPEPVTRLKPPTVAWALEGLPLQPDEHNWHIGRNPTEQSLERYKTIPEGGNRYDLMRLRPDITPPCWIKKTKGATDVFGRLWWDRPALTIRTEFYKPEKGRYLHPSEHRPITHREAARLQTFPDDFVFCGSKVEVARQIGNAVPPVLAYRLGLHISEALAGTASITTTIQTPLFTAT
jgi:DNA (cytosine-5)-methyltransferase 1